MTDNAGNAATESQAARKESFLARYPRKLKLGVTAAILVLIFLPMFISGESGPSKPIKGGEKISSAEHINDTLAGEKVKETEKLSAAEEFKVTTTAVNGQAALDAAKENDNDDHNARMPRAPEVGMTEESAEGILPRISENGRQPWQVYARPFNVADKRPRIAIVITDLGLSNVATVNAVDRMPSNVTLSFDTQSPIVGSWLNRARQVGHETLISIPMEPLNYPRSDPGPRTLLTGLPDADNLDRLNWAMRRGTGYVGVTTSSGSRFTTEASKLEPMLAALKQRGLLVFDARTSLHTVMMTVAKIQKIPTAIASRKIDDDPSPDAIDTALAQLEQLARTEGQVVGIASPLPATIDRLELWIKKLPEKGIALAPISAVVR